MARLRRYGRVCRALIDADCRLPRSSVVRCDRWPPGWSGWLGAVAWGAAAPRARCAQSRRGSAGREHRSRQRPERDRSAATSGASSARCVQLREAVEASRRHPRWRQPAEPWGASGRAAGADAGGPPASPGAAGWVGRGRCARSLAVGRREAACGHSEQPGCGANGPAMKGGRRAPAGAQRRNHSREARRVRRAPDLEPVQSRCGHTRRGSSRTRGTGCTCGASTRLRIELSGERWGVISNVKLLEPVRVEVISEKYVTTYATARARAGRPRSRLSLSEAARCSGGGGCHSSCASVDSSAAARRDGRSRSGHAPAPALHGRPVRPAARLL